MDAEQCLLGFRRTRYEPQGPTLHVSAGLLRPELRMPEAVVVDFPGYAGPRFYDDAVVVEVGAA